ARHLQPIHHRHDSPHRRCDLGSPDGGPMSEDKNNDQAGEHPDAADRKMRLQLPSPSGTPASVSSPSWRLRRRRRRDAHVTSTNGPQRRRGTRPGAVWGAARVLLAATFCCVAATSIGYGAAAGQTLASQMPEQARVAAGTVATGGLRQSPTVQFTPFPIEHGQAEKVSGDGFDPEVSCQILVDEVVQTEATCEVSGDGQVSGRFLAPGTGDTVSVWVCQADPLAEVPNPCGLNW